MLLLLPSTLQSFPITNHPGKANPHTMTPLFPWLSESLVARDDTTQSFHSLADEGWLDLLTHDVIRSMHLYIACSNVGGGALM